MKTKDEIVFNQLAQRVLAKPSQTVSNGTYGALVYSK